MTTEEGIKYRYEYSDEKSDKFWEIILNGNCYSVSYGRIGNNPQTRTKEFDSKEIALNEANKIRLAKEKKGYILAESNLSQSDLCKD
jgi:predicted DNA-binding WGR domain protein